MTQRKSGLDSDAFGETVAGDLGKGMDATAVDGEHVAHRASRTTLQPPVGTHIGRFVIIDKLGEGGMGVVVAAYDPQLDRRVAIKMMHDHVSDSMRARLEREARAMAQLNHPNVVAVYETGMVGDQLYIAMELVEGQTLGHWMKAAPRSREDILDRLIQAGRGLAAAHAGGLVHRDFKPDNVLVGNDGRVRVSDFGLVSAAADRAAAEQHEVTRDDRTPAVRPTPNPISVQSLTQTGAVMGTPLYMAPEQHDGRVADAKADQFGYCVTAWQCLCDQLPYGADSYEQLVRNVSGGKLIAPPRGSNVPASLRAILGRGLSAKPGDRYPSMDALLAALERDRRPARWPWFAGGGVVVAGAIAAGAFGLLSHPAKDDPCTSGAARAAVVWNADRKIKLASTMHATGATAADDISAKVAAALDRYAQAWAVHHRDVCLATAVRGEQSQELLDLRMHCMDRRLSEADAIIARISETTTKDQVFRVLDIANGLPALADCDDPTRLRSAFPLPADPAKRAQLAALEQRTAEAVALDRMGQWAKAHVLLDPLIADVRALDYPPLEAKLVLLRAGGDYREGNLALAETHYHEAADAAARARDDERLAQAWTDLISVLAAAGKYADALALQPIAQTSVERVSDRPLLGARLQNALAGIHQAQGKYAEAKAEYTRALELVRQDGDQNELYGPALINLGSVMWYAGQPADGEKLLLQGREWLVARYGPHHPTIAYVERNLGDLAATRQASDEAIKYYLDALAIFEDAHGPDHVDNAIALDPLCDQYTAQGDFAKAREIGERDVALRTAKLGPDHPSLANPLKCLAQADLGEATPAAAKDAIEKLQHTADVQLKAFGAQYPHLPETLELLGHAYNVARDPAGAVATYTQDEPLRIALNGAKSDELARVYASRGGTLALLHKAAPAAADFDRAAAAAVTPQTRAVVGMTAAHGLWLLGNHAAALAAGKAAREAAAADPASKDMLAALDAWLAQPQ